MTYTRKRALCWLYAVIMTAVLMAFLLLFTEVLYLMNDDPGILRAFMGYENGSPVSFHIYIHAILAWPLCWLSNAFPMMPWFTYAQLVLLAIGCVVLAKGIMQSFVKRDKPLWMGAVLAAACLLALFFKHITRITFTHTAALLGAAAVVQMFSIDHDRGAWRVVVGMAGALALVAYAYALRQVIILPLLAFCGLAFLILFFEHYGFGKKAKRSMKPMVISLLMVAVVVAGLVGLREWEIDHSGARDYLEWQDVNTEIIDYYSLSNVPQEALDMVGWDKPTYVMAQKWCFLDDDISTEAFRTLTDYMNAHDTRTFGDRLSQAWSTFATTVQLNPLDMRCLSLLLIVLAGVVIGACVTKQWRMLGYAALVLAGSVVMLLYLTIRGRFPVRALLSVALPAGGILLGLLPSCMPKKPALTAVCCVLCAALSLWCFVGILPHVLPDEEQSLELGNAMGDLEEYALSEPESLFIYDDTLAGADLRAFPDYSEGMPHNITFWGGWGMRSPQNVEMFENFGIDLNDFDPYTLLRDDVYIASGRVDPPPMVLLNWLHEKIGPNVDWEIWSEYGNVYIFHFYEY